MKATQRHRRQRNTTAQPFYEVVGPAVITPLHARDRELSKVAGAPKAWRKLSVLQQAYLHERLGPTDSNEARDRYAAGAQYTEWWDCSQKALRDSTANIDAGRSAGTGLPLNAVQREALARIEAIEKHLGGNDKQIIRNVCALGFTLPETMVALKLPKETRVSARFCEALDALRDAIDRTAKRRR